MGPGPNVDLSEGTNVDLNEGPNVGLNMTQIWSQIGSKYGPK